MTVEQNVASTQVGAGQRAGPNLRVAGRLAAIPQPDVPGQGGIPKGRTRRGVGKKDRRGRGPADAGVLLPVVREVAPDDAAGTLLKGECTEVGGEWGKPCPSCGQLMRAGKPIQSWKSAKPMGRLYSSGSSAGLGERKHTYTRSPEVIARTIATNRLRRAEREAREPWRARRRSARNAPT
jgi:hypothetical protein